MKRFYEEVSVVRGGSDFGIALDGRPLLTPRRRTLRFPSEALAEAVADEWRAQDDTVRLDAMPLWRLVAIARDSVAEDPGAVVDRVTGYAGTDLLCYRAASPQKLAWRQAALWQPILDWVAAHYGAAFLVTTGIVPVHQDPAALAAVRSAVETVDALTLAAVQEATTATGSVLLALALKERRLSAEEVIAASQLDERFQAERWGEDAEAAARCAALAATVQAAARFLRLLGS